MSLSTRKLSGQLSIFRFEEPAANATKKTIDASTYTVSAIDQVFIDNTANTHEVFLKIFNSSDVSLGSVDPYARMHCPAGKSKHYTFTGFALTACTFVVTKEAIATSNTDPDTPVPVVLLASD